MPSTRPSTRRVSAAERDAIIAAYQAGAYLRAAGRAAATAPGGIERSYYAAWKIIHSAGISRPNGRVGQ